MQRRGAEAAQRLEQVLAQRLAPRPRVREALQYESRPGVDEEEHDDPARKPNRCHRERNRPRIAEQMAAPARTVPLGASLDCGAHSSGRPAVRAHHQPDPEREQQRREQRPAGGRQQRARVSPLGHLRERLAEARRRLLGELLRRLVLVRIDVRIEDAKRRLPIQEHHVSAFRSVMVATGWPPLSSIESMRSRIASARCAGLVPSTEARSVTIVRFAMTRSAGAVSDRFHGTDVRVAGLSARRCGRQKQDPTRQGTGATATYTAIEASNRAAPPAPSWRSDLQGPAYWQARRYRNRDRFRAVRSQRCGYDSRHAHPGPGRSQSLVVVVPRLARAAPARAPVRGDPPASRHAGLPRADPALLACATRTGAARRRARGLGHARDRRVPRRGHRRRCLAAREGSTRTRTLAGRGNALGFRRVARSVALSRRLDGPVGAAVRRSRSRTWRASTRSGAAAGRRRPRRARGSSARSRFADAMYAPVTLRCRTYGALLSSGARAYCESVVADPHVATWIRDAEQEVAAPLPA